MRVQYWRVNGIKGSCPALSRRLLFKGKRRGAETRGTAGARLLLHSLTVAPNPGGSPCVAQAFSVRHPASAFPPPQIAFLLTNHPSPMKRILLKGLRLTSDPPVVLRIMSEKSSFRERCNLSQGTPLSAFMLCISTASDKKRHIRKTERTTNRR